MCYLISAASTLHLYNSTLSRSNSEFWTMLWSLHETACGKLLTHCLAHGECPVNRKCYCLHCGFLPSSGASGALCFHPTLASLYFFRWLVGLLGLWEVCFALTWVVHISRNRMRHRPMQKRMHDPPSPNIQWQNGLLYIERGLLP